MSAVSRGSLFPPELVPGLIQKTTGASAIAKLCNATPIPFSGQKEFTFSLDNEIDIVAENGAKGVGGGTVGSITIVPIKVEYGMRVSDEFMTASEEYKLGIMETFADGIAKKMAKGLDLMSIHGINPRTKEASAVIGANHFDSKIPSTNTVTASGNTTADALVEDAIARVQATDRDVTGMIMAPAFRSDLSKLTTTGGAKMFPELAWGNAPSVINGLRVESTSNLSFNSSLDRAIVGDFANGFKWGYAKEIQVEVIEYGNPDNDATAGDLKGHNQVYLRAEAFIGWAIMDENAFALIKAAS